jgi:hypothetical protein
MNMSGGWGSGTPVLTEGVGEVGTYPNSTLFGMYSVFPSTRVPMGSTWILEQFSTVLRYLLKFYKYKLKLS